MCNLDDSGEHTDGPHRQSNMQSRGHPSKKHKRNISGLRNQSSPSPACSIPPTRNGSTSPANSGLDQQVEAEPKDFQIVFDSTRVDWQKEDGADLDSDLDDEMDLDIWDDEHLMEKLVAITKKADDEDGEWLPPQVKKEWNQIRGEKCAMRF